MLFKFFSMHITFIKRIALFIFIGFLALLMIKVKVDHVILWDLIYQGQDVAANPDADYHLKLARDLVEQQFSFNLMIHTSLLPIFIALISRSTEFKDLIWAGNLLTPICCALTFMAIGLFFSIKSNFSPFGWITAFLSLLISYLCIRTGPGYIDTDLLNVFFVYLISALIYFQADLNDLRNKYFVAIAIGLLNFLFILWYDRPGFTLLFGIAILASQIFIKEKWKNIFGLLGIFILVSSLASFHSFNSPFASFLSFIDTYIHGYSLGTNGHDIEASRIVRSNVAVGELQTSYYKNWPSIIFEWRYDWRYGFILFILSIAGNIFWLLEDKKKLFAYFIPFTFIPLSLFLADRFYIYSIPLFWFGLFFMLKVLMILIKMNKKVSSIFAIALVVTIFSAHYSPRCFFIFDKDCESKVTLFRWPTIDVTKAISFARSHLIQENNTLMAWWDYGHYLALHTNFNLIANGAQLFNESTNKFADALIEKDQAISYQILKDLNQTSYNTQGKPLALNKIYLLINEELILKMSGLYKASNLEKIKLHASQFSIQPINCTKSGLNEMICNKTTINYKNGLVNNIPRIYKIVYENNQGKFLKEKILNAKGQDVIVNFSSGKDVTYNNIIISKWMYETTLMKLYLGQPNSKFFTPVYSHFPLARIYELH